jgi:hypothetical protein
MEARRGGWVGVIAKCHGSEGGLAGGPDRSLHSLQRWVGFHLIRSQLTILTNLTKFKNIPHSEVLRRVENRRFRGVMEGNGGRERGGRRRQRFYRGTLPPWGFALGLLTPWPTALGFQSPCPTAAGIWPHRAVHPTVGTTLNVVPHCGRKLLPPWGMAPDVHFSKFLVGPFIFRKSMPDVC